MQSTHVKSRSAASGAAEILRQIFVDIEHGLHLRLWGRVGLDGGPRGAPRYRDVTSLNAFKRVC